MRRAALVLVSLFVVPSASGTDWPAWGGGSAHAFSTPDTGPGRPEVAFVAHVPGAPLNGWSGPIVLGGSAFLLTYEGLWRIGLDDARVTKLTAPPSSVDNSPRLSSDGRRLFVVDGEGVTSYETDGKLLWRTTFPIFTRAPAMFADCGPSGIVGNRLLLGCLETPNVTGGRPPVPCCVENFATADFHRILFGFAVETGGLLFAREISQVVSGAGIGGSDATATTDPEVSVIGNAAFVYNESYTGVAPDKQTAQTSDLTRIDIDSGAALWSRQGVVNRSNLDPAAPAVPDSAQTTTLAGSDTVPTGANGVVVARLSGVTFLDAETGETLWAPADNESAAQKASSSPHFAAGPSGILVGWGPELRVFDPTARTEQMLATLTSRDEWKSIVSARGTIFAMSGETATASVVADPPTAASSRSFHYALNALEGSGKLRWSSAFDSFAQPGLAVSNGVLAISTRPVINQSQLTVFGRTNASIALPELPAEGYPPVGARIELDLSGTKPGVANDSQEYSVEWGDGSKDGWQSSPTFSHAYAARGDESATITARNGAGQVSIASVIYHVGAIAPAEPNFISQQFDNEHQNLTFFIVGIALTGVAGLAGVLRARRKRSILARELRALDQAHQLTRGNAREAERAFAERRTRARALLVDAKLDEGQFAVLDRRIDELARNERMAGIEQEFGFLTVGMAALLRGILADGRVERWERDHFLDALARDEHLTPEQKQRVRARIDEWFAQDAGAGA